MSRSQAVRALALAAIVGLAVWGPNLAWWLTPSRTLDVVVVDKTVPFRKFREHAAIPWILHALKIKGRSGRFLDPARDYVGYDPATKIGHDLRADDVANADVLVVTDTYGVYVKDYEKPGDIAALERSPKIYGGFSSDEAQVIESFASRGGLLVAEFNTFASPTDAATRARLEKIFGVRWTKWVARYWPKLEDENEVPRWVARLYEKVYQQPFSFTGGGLVFVLEDQDIFILRERVDLTAAVVEQVRTKAGEDARMPERGGFWFWMDVVAPVDGEVLYEHVVAATPAAADLMYRRGVPLRFPALVKNKNAYYFAGDFVDTALDMGNPERLGILTYKRTTLGCGGGVAGDEAFFWGFYAPIVSGLFESRAR